MRKIFLSILLATTVATPALAQRVDRDRSDSSERAERAERRAEARQQRAERAREQRSERADQPARTAPRSLEPPEPRERPPGARRGEAGPRRDGVEAGPMRDIVETPAAPAEVLAPPTERGSVERPNVNRRGRPTLGREDSPDSVADWRARDRDHPPTQRLDRWVEHRDGRVSPPPGASPNRPAPLPTTAHRDGRRGDWRDGRHPEWRRDWRRDHRYDWRSHRRHHRSSFHIGFYFDPFGWGYHRYNVGWRLWPSYYSNRYWLNDPWSYRLPQAPWPYRWVRYYNDAMLVNTTTGQVVDVIYDFFW